MNFFITATDTDVGKSYVSKHLAYEFYKKGLKVAYFKPFQSGIIEGVKSDVEQVLELSNNIKTKNSYVTNYPSTPLISAQMDNVEIDLNKVLKDYEELKNNNDIVITEGSGGFYVPVKENVLMSDVIKLLNLPIIIVARPDLGTINHTLMTIECAKKEGIKILGVIISNFPNETKDPVILRAKEMIEDFSDVKVIATIKKDQKDFSGLLKYFI